MAKSELVLTPALPEPQLLRPNLDLHNKRVIVRYFDQNRWAEVNDYLGQVTAHSSFEKIIILAKEDQVRKLLDRGYVFEATVDKFNKDDPVFYMSRFLTNKRREAAHWVTEDRLLQDVYRTEERSLPPLNLKTTIRVANEDDIPQLVKLFKETFKTYPSPLADAGYLRNSMQRHLFVLAEHDGKVISSASAELDLEFKNAEITNCATNPAYRGKGLISRMILILERELRNKQIYNSFSIARAKSFGMNAALFQSGYLYGGRLVNNCDICGDFEDMNVWGKDLRTPMRRKQ